MKNLMIDIDDVIFPLASKLHSTALDMGLHDGTEPALRVWHGHEQYGCTKERWHDVFEALHQEDWYLKAEPIPGVAEALRDLYFSDLGFRINLVTARGFMGRADDIRRWTAEWVEEFAIPHHTLTFARDKVAAQAELGRFDYAIDDGTHNYRALLADGVNATLLNQPHNADDQVRADHRVDSVPDWTFYVKMATALEPVPQRWVAGV